MNYELSFSQRALDGALFYGINLYYIDGDNMIMTVPTDGKPKNINTGEIENWGVESNISYRITSCWQIKRQLQLAATWRIRWWPLPVINSMQG